MITGVSRYKMIASICRYKIIASVSRYKFNTSAFPIKILTVMLLMVTKFLHFGHHYF